MKIFPIGTAVAATNLATIDSKKYAFFEPNKSVSSNKMHTTLVTRFENQSMLTRKKAEPFLMITYEYEDIFDREYRQVEHFLDDVDDALTSFRVVDLSKGKKPSAITDSSGDWVVSISNTRMYSATANLRADSAFVWNGRAWKEGSVSAITANTSITLDVDASNFGNLSLANAQTGGIVYPTYVCYANPNQLSNFKSTKYWNDDVDFSSDGGWMRSGTVSFVSKYKV